MLLGLTMYKFLCNVYFGSTDSLVFDAVCQAFQDYVDHSTLPAPSGHCTFEDSDSEKMEEKEIN